MLSAYLYRLRRQAVKKPVYIILVILAVISSVGMISLASFMGKDAGVRDPALVTAGFNAIFVVFFNYVFITAISQGVAGFTYPDINFHLAGPFTNKFNLILAAKNIFTICLFFIWMLTFQVALFVNTFGFRTSDMVGMIIGAFFVMVLAYFSGAFLAAWLDEKPVGKNAGKIGLLVVDVVLLGGAVISAISKAGSFGAFRALGGKGMVSNVFNSVWIKAYPVAGWTGLFFEGLSTNNIVLLIIGLVLVALVVSLLIYMFLEVEVNYYETAIATAEKYQDMREAQKAGVDSDSMKLNAKVKVGSETLRGGWGAGAFATLHHLMNARSSRLFFINTQTMLYRFITLFYLMFMSKSNMDEDGSLNTVIFAGLTMTMMLNAVVYGGGKTVLEFNKPYLFLVPEKGSTKLLACLLSDIPEIVFDSLLVSGMMYFFAKLTIPGAIALFFFMTCFSFVCELLGICTVRLFRGAGRFVLVLMRYILVGAAVGVTVIPGLILGGILFGGGFMPTLAIAAVLMVPIALILMFLGRNIVEDMEYGS